VVSVDVAVNLMGSVGAGKTAVLEATARAGARPEPSGEGPGHHREGAHGMIDAAAGSGGRSKER
jgi:hypothetical protein